MNKFIITHHYINDDYEYVEILAFVKYSSAEDFTYDFVESMITRLSAYNKAMEINYQFGPDSKYSYEDFRNEIEISENPFILGGAKFYPDAYMKYDNVDEKGTMILNLPKIYTLDDWFEKRFKEVQETF